MRVLLTGASGYVGGVIRAHLGPGFDVTGVDLGGPFPCDLRDPDAVRSLAGRLDPELVIHAAGSKDIGFCEREPEEALRINGATTENLVRAFGARARLVYISTDYVFDGVRGGYGEDDPPHPATAYGRSKLAGERAGATLPPGRFVVLRLSALYDRNASFPRFLREALGRGEPVDCFHDVTYSPTYYWDLIRVLRGVAARPDLEANVFHVCGEPTTRYAFARAFAEAFGFDAGLVRGASGRDAGLHLLPDLSLRVDRMRTVLGVQPTGIAQSLRELAGEDGL